MRNLLDGILSGIVAFVVFMLLVFGTLVWIIVRATEYYQQMQ